MLIVLSSIMIADIIINSNLSDRDFTSGGIFYHNSGDNAYFATNDSMSFSQIHLSENYVEFNNSKFNISSPNRVNITLVDINESLSGAVGDTFIKFYANTSSGNVYFNISGFTNNQNISVYRDSIVYTNVSANSSGWISFNDSTWSEHLYDLQQGSGTTWQTVNSSINGSYTNTTQWFVINNTINGSYTNTTLWVLINNSINGSYSNETGWNTIISTINGSYSNQSSWHTVDNTINGSYNSISYWTSVITTINGSYNNGSNWREISSIINGSYINSTSWYSIITTINGSYSNQSSWHVVDSTINGTYTSELSWNSVITTINGSFNNGSNWNTVSSNINGSYTNTTSWISIITTVNGSYTNVTAWSTITTTINGSFANTTSFVVVSSSINGSYTNTSSWQIINNSINGSYANTSLWIIEKNTVNGSYINGTGEGSDDDDDNDGHYQEPPKNIEFRTHGELSSGKEIKFSIYSESTVGNIYYRIIWGDGNITDWFGPYTPYKFVYINHTYSCSGIYEATLEARIGESELFSSESIYVEIDKPLLEPTILIYLVILFVLLILLFLLFYRGDEY